MQTQTPWRTAKNDQKKVDVHGISSPHRYGIGIAFDPARCVIWPPVRAKCRLHQAPKYQYHDFRLVVFFHNLLKIAEPCGHLGIVYHSISFIQPDLWC